MPLRCFSFSITGPVRPHNEDAILSDPASGLIAVADGVGGLPNGQLASTTAIDALKALVRQFPTLPAEVLLDKVNAQCLRVGFDHDPRGFATTLTFARLLNQRQSLQVGHIGDSQAILFEHNAPPRRISSAHTVAARKAALQRVAAANELTPITDTDHHTLTQCLGQSPEIDPQFIDLNPHSTLALALATDGIPNALGPRWFDALHPLTHPESQLRHLLANLQNTHPADNCSLVLALL